MHGKILFFIMAAVVTMGLAGCSDSSSVKIFKPGVYKGSVDPLQEKQRNPQQQAALRERFQLVQKDR